MPTFLKVTELGGKRMNPLAGSTNLWKLTNDLCDCTTDPTCVDYAYSNWIDTPVTISAMEVDGVTVPVTPTSTSDVADLKEALEAAIAPYENAPYFELIEVGDDLLIKHYGATVVSSYTSDDGQINTVRVCELQKACTFTGSDVDVITPLLLTLADDSVEELSITGGPFEFSGTVLDDEATAQLLQNQLYTALIGDGYVGPDANSGVNAIVVTPNIENENYDIIIPRVYSVVSISSLGGAFTKSNCVDDFPVVGL